MCQCIVNFQLGVHLSLRFNLLNLTHCKAPVPFCPIFFRLFTIEINSEIVNILKPIGMMKMQCVTIYYNIYECVSDYMKIHHNRF